MEKSSDPPLRGRSKTPKTVKPGSDFGDEALPKSCPAWVLAHSKGFVPCYYRHHVSEGTKKPPHTSDSA